MRIQHNIPAMNAYRNYNTNVKSLQANLQKLSSGYKINKAGDDAAGLAISEKMRAQISGLEMAQKNAKDGISLVQTAEGAMTEIHTMLNRMFSLAEQSANGTYDDKVDRVQLQQEFDQLRTEIDRIADATNFNGKKLLDGTLDGPTDSASPTAYGVKAGLDGTNAGKLDSVKIAAAGADDDAKAKNLQAISDALDGKEIKIKFENDTTAAVGAGDKITVTGLPEGVKLSYMDGSSPSVKKDVTDGTAVDIAASAGAANKLAVGADGSLTFTIEDTNGNALGTMSVKMDAALAGGDTGETTITFESVTEKPVEAATATVEPDQTQNVIKSVALTFADDADAAARNKLNGALQDLTITTKKDATNGDGITFGGLPAGYTLTAKCHDNSADITIGSTEVKFGTANNTQLKSPTANDKLAITIKDGTKTVGTLELTYAAAPTNTAGSVDKVKFTVPEEDGPAYKGTALRLRVGDSVHSYDDIKVGIRSLKADSLTDETDYSEDKELKNMPKLKLSQLGIGYATKEEAAKAGDENLNADYAMTALKGMINYVSGERGKLGAIQNRLDHTINNLSTMQENIQDAESTIRDVDVADEMMKYTKNNILVQSAQAMLAQANQLPQGVLQLLG